MFSQRENDLDGQDGAIGQDGSHLQRVIIPTALETSGQCALERRLARFVEDVHDRLTDQTFGVAVKLDPGWVGVDNDAFLDLDNCVVGPLQHRFELPARFVSGFDRRPKCALQTESSQFANDDRMQPRRIREGNDVACTADHSFSDSRFGDFISKGEDRNAGRYLVANARDRLEFEGR